MRAFVEHSFHIVKNLLNLSKICYRGLAKNDHPPYMLFGLAVLAIGAPKVTA